MGWLEIWRWRHENRSLDLPRRFGLQNRFVVDEIADAAGESVEALKLSRAEVAEPLDLFLQLTGFAPGTAGKHQRTDGHDEDRRGDDQEKENDFIHGVANSAGNRDPGKLIKQPWPSTQTMGGRATARSSWGRFCRAGRTRW